MGAYCGKLKSCCKPSSLLSYSTVKVVQINDWRLGLLHYFFLLGVLGYIVGFVVVYQMRYLVLESPVGSIRTTLMSTQTRCHQKNPPDCFPTPPEQLDYCIQSGNGTVNGYPKLECVYFDENLVLFPPVETKAMFISTHITKYDESTNCSLTTSNCTYKRTSPKEDYFVADIENFTMLVDHSMYAQSIGLQANSYEMPGILYDINGDERKIPPNNRVGVIHEFDILTIDLMLKAAGIKSLDDASMQTSNRSLRDYGVILLFFITYSNTYTYKQSNIRYEYRVKPVKNVHYSGIQPVYTKKITDRVIWDRHGIRVMFIQNGQLGKFDFQTLLLSFVSGLGLVAVTTLIVDLIALRLLPHTSRLYRRYKYEETPNHGLEVVTHEDAVSEYNEINNSLST